MWTHIKPYLIMGVLTLISVLGLLELVRRNGALKERINQTYRILQDMEQQNERRKEIRRRVDQAISDGAVDADDVSKRLRDGTF